MEWFVITFFFKLLLQFQVPDNSIFICCDFFLEVFVFVLESFFLFFLAQIMFQSLALACINFHLLDTNYTYPSFCNYAAFLISHNFIIIHYQSIAFLLMSCFILIALDLQTICLLCLLRFFFFPSWKVFLSICSFCVYLFLRLILW